MFPVMMLTIVFGALVHVHGAFWFALVPCLGLLAYEVSQLRDNTIRRLRAEGHNHEAIAKLFKISASRVCQINAVNN